MIPPRQKFPEPGTGTKAQGGKLPIPVNLKVTYGIGRETPPIVHIVPGVDYTITTEVSGEIAIELQSPISAAANLGLYLVEVHAETPMKYSGTLKPPTAEGTTQIGGHAHKFSADLEYKVTVDWHPNHYAPTPPGTRQVQGVAGILSENRPHIYRGIFAGNVIRRG